MMKNLQRLIILIISLLALFVTSIILSQVFNKKKPIKKEDALDLVVNKVRHYKGLVVINDTIAIFENTPQIFKNKDNSKNNFGKREDFGDLNTPFRIIKKSNNDIIIKKFETLYYKLIEDNGW